MFSLLDQSFTTVHVQIHGDRAPKQKQYRDEDLSYEANMQRLRPPVPQGIQTYTYKVPKTWGIKEGDLLVVPTRGTVGFANVVKVDAEPEIDVDADFTYKWAIQRVDFEYHNELVANEKKFADTLQEVERVKQRESLLESFRSSLPEGSAARQLFEQTTASLAPPIAPQAPPPAPAPESK
jgi:hypothetical protein